MSSNLNIPKTCNHCGKAFIAKKFSTKFCGHPCAARDYKLRMKEQKLQVVLKEEQAKYHSTSTNEIQSRNLHNKEFLSIKDTANLLGASRWTIQRLIKKQILSVAKIGRRTIIKRSEIDQLFK